MLKKLLLALSLLVFGLSCSAEEGVAGKTYVEGTDYDLINPPVHTANPDKIEVAEFFWYGCPHCYDFESLLEPWKKSLPDDVSFRGIPAVWRDVMELHAKAYYTADGLGVLDTMHPLIFKAMHVDHKPLASEKEIGALFVANGVSEEDFDRMFTSFGVDSEVNQGISIGKSARITGTPALMVDGKYLISGRTPGGQPEMLKVADFLIEKERAARGN
jgi:thiol:disulfide interchange protein DsbA